METKSSTPSNQTDAYTISNKEWTITIGNKKSWSGVNGMGNLSYRGCESQSKCLELTGRKVTCRQGICIMGWKNGEYSYVVKEPITESGAPTDASCTTLEVRQGDKLLLTGKDFQTVN